MWEAAGFLGMSEKTLRDTYGHHHPDHLRGAADAIGSRPASKVGLVVSLVAAKSQEGRAAANPCKHWWACLDSNQEPDRYERPALTIELQAPPQAARFKRHATVPPPLTMRPTIRQSPGKHFNPSLPGLTRQSIFFFEKGFL
jgi:hypothetical protein